MPELFSISRSTVFCHHVRYSGAYQKHRPNSTTIADAVQNRKKWTRIQLRISPRRSPSAVNNRLISASGSLRIFLQQLLDQRLRGRIEVVARILLAIFVDHVAQAVDVASRRDIRAL